MKEEINSISKLSIIGLKIQGYVSCPVKQLAGYRLGIRFAYGTCATIILLGLSFQNVYFIFTGLTLSLGGMLLPRQPVDYLYNRAIRHIFKKPAIPKRPPQSRFACSIAFVWIATALLCRYNDYYLVSSAMEGALVMQAYIVTFTDICFPSMIYNFLLIKTTKLIPEP